MISAVAISMFLVPLVFIAHDKFSKNKDDQTNEQQADSIERGEHKVILAGFGRLGTDLGRFLISAGIKPVIIDYDITNITLLRKLGFEVYYGDITRLDLLEAAGAETADVLVITIGDLDKAKALVELAKKHYPHLKLVVNAHNRFAAFELMDLGVETIRRETFGSALALGQDTMQLLGIDAYDAHRQMRIFKKQDEKMMPELHQSRTGEKDYISAYQQQHANLEKVMTLDNEMESEALDKSWNAKNPED